MIRSYSTGSVNILFLNIICDVSGEEEEEAGEDEEELDGMSSSPGKPGLISSVDTDSRPPEQDEDPRGEAESTGLLTPECLQGIGFTTASPYHSCQWGNCKTDLRSVLRIGGTTSERVIPREILHG